MVLILFGLGLFFLALLFFIPAQWLRRTGVNRDELNRALMAHRLTEMAAETSGEQGYRQVLTQEAKQDFLAQSRVIKQASNSNEQQVSLQEQPYSKEQPLKAKERQGDKGGHRAHWQAALAFTALVSLFAVQSDHLSDRVYWQQQLADVPPSPNLDTPVPRQSLVKLFLHERVKLASEPHQPLGWARLSEWALQLGQVDDAIQAITRAYQQDQDNKTIALQYAKVHVMSGAGSIPARQILLSLAKQAPLDPEVFVLLGVDAYQQAHYQSALAFWSIAQSNGAAQPGFSISCQSVHSNRFAKKASIGATEMIGLTLATHVMSYIDGISELTRVNIDFFIRTWVNLPNFNQNETLFY